MKKKMFDQMIYDEGYSDTNGPLASIIVAAFWSIVGIVMLIETIRLIKWIIELIF